MTRLTLALAALASLPGALEASTPPAAASPGVQRWLSMAREAFDQERYPEALQHYLKVLEAEPGDLEAKKGVLEVSRAVALWEEKTRLKPGELVLARARALQALGDQKAQMGRMAGELDQIAQALEERNQRYLLSASVSLIRSSEEEFSDAYFAAQAKRYLEELKSRFQSALRQKEITDPKDLRLARGFLYYHKGLFKLALEEWQGALSLDPNDGVLQQQVGWLGERIKRTEERRRIESLAREADKWFNLELYERSVRTWAQVLALEPRNAKAIAGLAKAQGKLKDELLAKQLDLARKAARQSRALDALQRWVAVLELDPTNAEAVSAVQEWRKGQPKSSSKAPPKADLRGPARPLEAEEQYAVGMAYYAQRELPLALDAMEKALRLNPRLGKAQVAVQRIRAEMGR